MPVCKGFGNANLDLTPRYHFSVFFAGFSFWKIKRLLNLYPIVGGGKQGVGW